MVQWQLRPRQLYSRNSFQGWAFLVSPRAATEYVKEHAGCPVAPAARVVVATLASILTPSEQWRWPAARRLVAVAVVMAWVIKKDDKNKKEKNERLM